MRQDINLQLSSIFAFMKYEYWELPDIIMIVSSYGEELTILQHLESLCVISYSDDTPIFSVNQDNDNSYIFILWVQKV